MGLPEEKYLTLADYLTIERAGDQRYEYHLGEIFAMAGGTVEHGVICGNVYAALRSATQQTGACQAFTSEIKVEIKSAKRYVYPDAGLACPKLIKSATLTGAITNPRLIVEVISASSEGYDRGAKLRYYFSVPSLQEYVLVDQDQPFVTIFRRRGDLMKMDTYDGIDAAVPLESVVAEIALKDIYENVEFPEKEVERDEQVTG
ncbi:Uma2 family endonuclease [Neolewinella antarctica]|uniref:Uma2 family endonuclease n=1 Tax=Neolewinella antarctica TaxID=442734 RepID=A0ABX0XCL4_9BACT|nr:Uma2 family endonuclease [Neolewinella antarctica]NJC27000.1 Uma2 family endonuclease [Neolewinella antarctica]